MGSSNDGRGRTPLSLVGPDPDVVFYARLAVERPGPVLVLGSATGRVAWGLGERGHAALGVDPSGAMVRGAEERRATVAPEVSGRVRFLSADVRALRLAERFGLVVAPQHALGLMGTLEELEAFLATVRHHLGPGGVFAFDVVQPPGPAAPRSPEGPPTSALEPLRRPFALHLRERRREGGRPGGIRRLRLRPFRADELESALGAAGLVLHERYGGFDGKPLEPGDAVHVGVARAEGG